MNPHAEPGPIAMADGKLVLSPVERADWLTRLDAAALDLALIEVAGWVRPNASRPVTSQARAKLAEICRRKLEQDQRYAKAVASKPVQGAEPRKGMLAPLGPDAEARIKARLAALNNADGLDGSRSRSREVVQ